MNQGFLLDDRRIRIRNTGKGNMRVLQLLSSRTSKTSVADPGCLSRIPDPKTATKERDKKN
jgi:hypothetical protein